MKIIISVALAALLFVGCSEEKSHQKEALVEAKKAPTTAVAIAHKVDAAIDSASKTADEVSTSVKKVSDATIAKTKEIIEQSKEIAIEVSNQAEDSVDAVMAEESDVGLETYTSCAACHGHKGEKAALGKSQIIQGWSVDKVKTALNGYVNGSYGGPMKAIMKGQAARLSEDEIKAVSEYISGL